LLVILSVSHGYAATNETSARLTIEVVVMLSVQNQVAIFQNSGTVPSGSGVTFNFAPDSSQGTTSRIDVRAVPTGTLDRNEETSSSDRSDQSILQTLTVIVR
jgi:hypothetical protein